MLQQQELNTVTATTTGTRFSSRQQKSNIFTYATPVTQYYNCFKKMYSKLSMVQRQKYLNSHRSKTHNSILSVKNNSNSTVFTATRPNRTLVTTKKRKKNQFKKVSNPTVTGTPPNLPAPTPTENQNRFSLTSTKTRGGIGVRYPLTLIRCRVEWPCE